MRTAFLKALEEAAAEDPRVNLMVGDLGFTVIEPFAKRFPGRFFNAGVAEQNMAGVAAGMALSGKVVFIYSIANFPTLRCLEQIRNDGCYHEANLKVVSVGGGLSYGALGSSHQATEDIAIMRALPGMTVVAPGDPVESAAATRAVIEKDGPCYLRLGKTGEPRIHREDFRLELGKAALVRDGRDLSLISTGAILGDVLKAADELGGGGVSVRVVSMHTVKPLDAEMILRCAEETGAVATVEEHNVNGGLGGAVAEVLSQSWPRRGPFRIIGLADGFCRHVGGQAYLRGAAGLGVRDIVRECQALLDARSRGGS